MSMQTVDPPVFPFDTSPAADDDTGLARLRDEGPLRQVRIPTGEVVWLVTRHAEVKQLVSDQRFSRAANTAPDSPTLLPGVQFADMLINMDPPAHTRVRKLFARAFNVRAIDGLRPRIAEITDGLLADLAAAGPPGDLVGALTRPLTTQVICELLGVPFTERERLADFVRLFSAVPPPSVEQTQAVMADTSAYLLDLAARRRREPADDLLTALVEVHDGSDRLTEAELLHNTMLLFAAGHDTTLNHLANSVLTLFRHPDQLARLVAEPELIPAAVDELLRYVRLSSVGIARIASTDVEVGGVLVRAGEAVIPIFHAANRDPAVFDRPDQLDVTRPDAGAHIQFGHGIHYCLGASLARTELELGLHGLLTRFPGLRLAVDEAELDWLPGYALRRLRRLPVSW